MLQWGMSIEKRCSRGHFWTLLLKISGIDLGTFFRQSVVLSFNMCLQAGAILGAVLRGILPGVCPPQQVPPPPTDLCGSEGLGGPLECAWNAPFRAHHGSCYLERPDAALKCHLLLLREEPSVGKSPSRRALDPKRSY